MLLISSNHMDRFHNKQPSQHYGRQKYASKTCQYTWSAIDCNTRSHSSRKNKQLQTHNEEVEENKKAIRTTAVTVISENIPTVCCKKDTIDKTITTNNKKHSDNDDHNKDKVLCFVVTAEKNIQSDHDDSDSDDDEDEIIDVVGITENHGNQIKDNAEIMRQNETITTTSTSTNVTSDKDDCCFNASCLENTYHCCPPDDKVIVGRLRASSSSTIQYSRCKIKDNVSVVGCTDSSLWTTQVIEEGYFTPSTTTASKDTERCSSVHTTTSTEQCYSSCCNKDRANRKRPSVTVLTHCKDEDELQSSGGPTSPKRAFILSDNLTPEATTCQTYYTVTKDALRHDENALVERNSAFKTVQQHSIEKNASSTTDQETTVYENDDASMEYQNKLNDDGEEETIPYSKPSVTKTEDHIIPSTLSQSQVNILFNQSPIYGTRGIEKYFKSIPMNNAATTTVVETKSELLVSQDIKPVNKKQTAIVKPLPISEVATDDTTDNKELFGQEHIPKLFQNGDNKKIFIKVDQRKDFVIKHGDKLFGGSWVPTKSEEDSSNFLNENTEMEEDYKDENLLQEKDGYIKEEVEDDEENNLDRQSSPFLNKNKKSRNKEASKQYREKRKHAIKEVFQKQHELEERNNKLREQLKFMEHLTVNMQKTFAKKMDTKEKIKMEIMKLIKRSVAGNDNASAADLRTEIAVLQKIFQRVANESLTKGCVEEAIYEILGEVIKQ